MREESLSTCEKNKQYTISKLKIENEKLKRQLKNLGFIEGEKISFSHKGFLGSSFMVQVMGIDYAVDKKICEMIMVKVDD